ncbi:MAG TPA: NAD-dependent deacylase [Actinomycetota bacterium]|nr:NAD-dependent deacylase [Actinomycetota bacterium]
MVDAGPVQDGLIGEVAGLLRDADRVTALTGAGISTESGIPDFRGPQGVWTKDPKAERLSTLQAYLEDPELRVRAWRLRMEHPAWDASPNAGHRALAELERKGKLHALVTQNIDGLHQKAGTSPDRLIEIHGTLREVMCMSCDDRAPMEAALARVRAGEPDPPCRTCGGILKSATISFGQPLNQGDMERARAAAEASDVFLAIGTSLTVYPVAYLPGVAARAGARVVVMNAEPTAYDRSADVVVRASIGRVLPEIVARV